MLRSVIAGVSNVIRGINLLFQILLAMALSPSSHATPLVQLAMPNASILASCQLVNGGVAVAVANPGSGGAYYVLVAGNQPVKLGEFSGEADLACFSPEETTHLNTTIAESEIISGRIVPIGSSTIICGFLSSVEAACWQLDNHGGIRHVGGWVT